MICQSDNQIIRAMGLYSLIGVISLFISPLMAQNAIKPQVLERTARSLNLEITDLEVQLPYRKPRRAIAFLPSSLRDYPSTRHSLVISSPSGSRRTHSIEAVSYLDKNGAVLRQESVETIDDAFRMPASTQEKGTRQSGRSIAGEAGPVAADTLKQAWASIANRVSISDIREFELAHVLFDFGDEQAARPVLIFYIWGPDNPLGMPDELPGVLKNRIRIIYDISRKEISADNLL
ncbi:hypothetical protein AB833_22430 [Chromatiales bacterium (ex Bugula neritina AB1)]|nr:hypothetical protein AB833_22430 [Chromatiales bacterium (ex Bugula neritina AB1)]